MYIFQRLLQQSIHLNSEQLKKKKTNTSTSHLEIARQAAANRSKTVTSSSSSSNDSLFSIAKKNKILVFIGIFITVGFIFHLKPDHQKRPEILARNRLEKRSS